MRPDGDRWVMRLNDVARPRVRLICVPYAGGSPELFRSWVAGLSPDVELVAVRLPGHGCRLKEKPYTDWDLLVEDTVDALEPLLREPFALYGHSFGARLSYEVTHRVEAGPHRGLFVSGCRSPDRTQHRPLMHPLSDTDFDAAVQRMGGTPAEVLSTPAMMRMLRPVIRGEIRLAEIWDDRHGHGVDVPITACYGRDDPIDDHDSTRGWSKYSTRGCELIEFPGGHFFIESHRHQLVEAINARLGQSQR